MVFTVSITIKKKIEGTNSDVAPLDQVINFPFYLKLNMRGTKWQYIFIFYSFWYFILSRVRKLICVYFKDITTKTVNGLAGSIIGIKPSVILLLLITSSEVWVASTTTRRSKYFQRKHKLWNLKLIQSEGM